MTGHRLCIKWIEDRLPKLHVHLEPQVITLFRNRIFTDIISYGSQGGIISDLGRERLNPVIGVLTRGGEDTQEQATGRVKTEAELGVMLSQAKGRLGPPDAGRGRDGFSWRGCRGSVVCQDLGFRPLASRAMRESTFLLFSATKFVVL